jgi:hypothetical protein
LGCVAALLGIAIPERLAACGGYTDRRVSHFGLSSCIVDGLEVTSNQWSHAWLRDRERPNVRGGVVVVLPGSRSAIQLGYRCRQNASVGQFAPSIRGSAGVSRVRHLVTLTPSVRASPRKADLERRPAPISLRTSSSRRGSRSPTSRSRCGNAQKASTRSRPVDVCIQPVWI